MIVIAGVVGYLIGSIPTATWIAAGAGVDLRQHGSRNPGANNARSLGGLRLAAVILLVEIGKGAGAVAAGGAMAGSGGAAVAGVAALAGNVYNVWYRFGGGQGLGITAGILLAGWPVWLPVVVVMIAGVTALTRSTPKAAIAALATILLGAGIESVAEIPDAWGVGHPDVLILAAGLIVLITPKQIKKLTASQHPTVPGVDDERDGPVVE